jgi:uncharacterized repeat protein (TIGR04138 family)
MPNRRPLLDPSHPIAELLRKDDRYSIDAYVFVFEALEYAQNVLEMGTEVPSEAGQAHGAQREATERHVTGEELCEAVRQVALEHYGYMAKTVLNSWGIHKTGDFGEIVFNLIRIGQMRKTASDRREDFDNVYEFDVAFQKEFKICLPE